MFQEIVQDLYKSDLPYYQKEQEADPAYPVVSLFNLDEDPQETTNLASKHPHLVKELLEEAEEILKNAPKQWRGDMVHAQAPVSKQQGWMATLRSLGSVYEEVIPFGIYLNDDDDLTKLEYVRLADQAFPDSVVIIIKTLLVFVVVPFLLLLALMKYIL